MSTLGMLALAVLAGGLYGAAALRSWLDLRRGSDIERATWALALGGLGAQVGALLWQWGSEGQVVLAGGAAGSLGLFAACVAVGYLLLALRYRGPLWGALLLPVASLASLVGVLWGAVRGGGALAGIGVSWTLVHIIPSVVGITCLAAGAALAVMYLLQERYLRKPELDEVLRWLPALEVLDQLSGRAVALSFALLSVGLVAGGVRALATKELGAGWLLDPKVVSATATWVLVAGLCMVRRRSFGGRRMAQLTLLAAALAAFTYVGVDALRWGGHAGL